MRVLDAAKHVANSYNNLGNLPIWKSFDDGTVQAYVLKDRTLIIPGTNDGLIDWDVNARLKAVSLTFGDFPTAPSLAGTMWHQGFLEFAKVIYDFALPLGVQRIAGHSLGGAAAQVLAPVMRLKTVTFGAPRSKHKKTKVPNEHLTLNLALKRDKVPQLLGWTRFRQAGARHSLDLSPRKFPNHKMAYYIEALTTSGLNGSVPSRW
jgi:hypothetical protein